MILSLWASPISSQVNPYTTDTANRYTYYYEYTSSGADRTVTLHVPSGAANRAYLDFIRVTCAAECSLVTLSRNGTAPTATDTSADIVKQNTSSAGSAKTYAPSDVGSGTVITKEPSVGPTGVTFSAPQIMYPSGGGTTKNISVLITSFNTTVVRVTLGWGERRN